MVPRREHVEVVGSSVHRAEGRSNRALPSHAGDHYARTRGVLQSSPGPKISTNLLNKLLIIMDVLTEIKILISTKHLENNSPVLCFL